MTVILIILGIVAVILMIRAVNNQGKNKNELISSAEKMQKEIFPNGQIDIDEGTKKLLQILNNNIDKKTAKNIFVKSSSICYITSMKGTFSVERLKQHLEPYALDYFNDNTLSLFYDYILSKNERATELDSLLELSREFSKSSNPTGTDKDIMLEGYGEFGLEITNPIPTSSIPDSYLYLGRLRTQNGSEIIYNRIGSMGAPNISHSIDGYSISSNGQKIATVYICPYNKKTSSKAPKGFMLS